MIQKKYIVLNMENLADKNFGKIPAKVDAQQILKLLQSGIMENASGKKYFSSIKKYSEVNDKQISTWLGLSERTYNTYKHAKTINFKPQLQEQILMILSVMKHGKEVFGTFEGFSAWLESENFHFGNQRPTKYLTTASGIKFVDDCLSAMEYGDNV